MRNTCTYNELLELCDENIKICYELKCAIEAVLKAWESDNCLMGIPTVVKEKGRTNFVTDYDLIIEKKIVEYLYTKIENYPVISEETFPHKTNSDIYWVLDPIDGTTNLLHNYESISTALALIKHQQAICSVVFNPFKGEVYFSNKGRGAYKFKNGEINKLRVSENCTLRKSMIGTGFPYDKKRVDYILEKIGYILKLCQDIKRNGPASLDICYVAEGKIDAYFELDLQLWDFMASSLILQEAGGKISYWNNDSRLNVKGNILATNGYLHDVLIEILNK